MKALTVRQPHAQLIALGVKTIETRMKPTKYRGPLLIHAGRRSVPKPSQTVGDYTAWPDAAGIVWMVDRRIHDFGERMAAGLTLPLGAIVASCKLVDCVPTENWQRWFSHAMNQRELPVGWSLDSDEGEWNAALKEETSYGNFTPGRYAWLLEDIQPVEQRCPACWGTGSCMPWMEADGSPSLSVPVCSTCGGRQTCDPIPAKGKLGIWNWEP